MSFFENLNKLTVAGAFALVSSTAGVVVGVWEVFFVQPKVNQIAELENQINQLQIDLQNASECTICQTNLATKQRELSGCLNVVNGLKEDKRGLENQITSLENQIDRQENQTTNLENQIGRQENQIRGLERQIGEQRKSNESLSKQLASEKKASEKLIEKVEDLEFVTEQSEMDVSDYKDYLNTCNQRLEKCREILRN